MWKHPMTYCICQNYSLQQRVEEAAVRSWVCIRSFFTFPHFTFRDAEVSSTVAM